LKDIQEISDEELFKTFVKKDKSELLFREVMKRFKQKVYWQVRRIVILHDDADDVVQNVFIKLWKNAESFKYNSALSSYIFRIAYNESITFLKKKRNLVSFDEILDIDGHLEGSISDGSEMNGDQIMQNLMQALLKLPEKQRLVFQYKYFDDLSYKEIAEITGTSEGALKANYHHAIDKIKKFIDPN
jgi:RNA polymerase sigma factor (sigma-70 family)